MMRELGLHVTIITASAHYLTGDIPRPVRWLWRGDEADGTRFVRTWSPRAYRRSSALRLFTYLMYSSISLLAGLFVRDVDVVLSATDPPFFTPSALLLSRLHRSRLVLDERDVFPETADALGMSPSPLVSAVIAGWNKWLRGRANSVITVSPGLKRLLLAAGAKADRIYIIPNYFASAEPRVQPMTRPSGSRFTVLYAGSLGQATHLASILDAARIVKDAGYADVCFRILGAGERRAEYETQAKALGLDNLEFGGVVPRSAMAGMYAQTDITVHSLPAHPYWRNAISTKVLEYLAHGKPVVFAGEGDIADLLGKSQAGLVVTPQDGQAIADAVMRLRDAPDLVADMSERAVRYIRVEYDRERMLETFRTALGFGSIPEG